MKLSDLLYGVSIKSVIGKISLVEVSKIEFDSRKVMNSDLFISIKGVTVDGHDYIDAAIKNGATSGVVENIPENKQEGICYVVVECSSTAMSIIAANYYDNPSEKLKLVGVTGTNGKTTIVTLLHQLFTDLGYPSGMLSTIENRIGTISVKSTHTTGDSLQINQMLSDMVNAGCDYCFMEVSSHAIHQNRVSNLKFEGGIFTNITHEHLDYHKDFREYISTKKKFFDDLGSTSFAITNKDDKNGRIMTSNTSAFKITYSLKTMADYKCRVLESRFDGMLLNIQNHEIWVKIIGEFNAYNLLAIYSTSVQLGLNETDVLEKISDLNPAEGRFHTVRNSESITGIVDYMHTPDAYENALENVLNEAKQMSGGKLHVVFGCGGDRDKKKRPLMGKIACKYADSVVVTDDNPRNENPQSIRNQIIGNSKNIIEISDRKKAIKYAINNLLSQDILIIAGKGHEKYQLVKNKSLPFDDVKISKKYI